MSEEQQAPSDGDELVQALVDRLAEVVPIKLVAAANRAPMAESFVTMLGRLVEFLEQFKPLDHGQMAALLFFVDNLKLDHVGADASFIMLSMIDGAKNASRKIRRGQQQ